MLGQDQNDNRDGMDISVCVWDKADNTMEFAGANQSLIYVQNKQVFSAKGNRTTISFEAEKPVANFNKKAIPLSSDTMFYLFTDGYVDQFGGPEDKKFMMSKFRKMLLSVHDKTVQKQEKILRETMKSWMQDTEQVDDILVMGVRLNE